MSSLPKPEEGERKEKQEEQEEQEEKQQAARMKIAVLPLKMPPPLSNRGSILGTQRK